MEQTKNVLTTINTENDTLYDLIYDALFYMAYLESEDDIKNGRVMTLEESKERMRKKYANFNVE